MKRDLKFYFQLFWAAFKLSAVTFGGGYVIVPLMRREFVERLNWIDESEMLNFVAIAQSSPGAMAVNTSIMVGYHLAGIGGACISLLGTILPPLILLSVISVGYSVWIQNEIVKNVLRGMQAGVCAVIVDVVIQMGGNIVKTRSMISIFMMIAAFVAVFVLKINVFFVVLGAALIGLALIFRKGARV